MINSNEKENKRNITLSLPYSLIHKAKLAAVREDKSLNMFIKEVLEEKIGKKSAHTTARLRQLKLLKSGYDLGTKGQTRFSREKLHERK